MSDRETKTFRRLVPFLLLALFIAFGVGVAVGERRGAAKLEAVVHQALRV